MGRELDLVHEQNHDELVDHGFQSGLRLLSEPDNKQIVKSLGLKKYNLARNLILFDMQDINVILLCLEVITFVWGFVWHIFRLNFKMTGQSFQYLLITTEL